MDNEAYQVSTPLFRAITTGDTQAVKRLLAAGEDPNECYGEDDENALLVAAVEGRTEIAQLLLAAGADPNAQETKTCFTPLMSAVYALNPECVQLLLQAGADTATVSCKGDTAAEILEYRADDMWKPTMLARATKIRTLLQEETPKS